MRSTFHHDLLPGFRLPLVQVGEVDSTRWCQDLGFRAKLAGFSIGIDDRLPSKIGSARRVPEKKRGLRWLSWETCEVFPTPKEEPFLKEGGEGRAFSVFTGFDYEKRWFDYEFRCELVASS